MGLLIDLQKGRRDSFGAGAFVVFFWLMVGAAATGLVSHAYFSNAETGAEVAVAVGALIGACVGFYAAWGNSWLATILALLGLPFAVFAPLVVAENALGRKSKGRIATGNDLPSRTLRDLHLTGLNLDDVDAPKGPPPQTVLTAAPVAADHYKGVRIRLPGWLRKQAKDLKS